MNGRGLSRRAFLIGTALSAAGSAAAAGKKRRKKKKSANEKLNIAGIGIGGQGGHDIHQLRGENIVALCDVDWRKAGKVFEAYPKAKKFKDFRVMLEKRKDIDAVVVATPDHMHAVASMMAIKMGKHVYCEKPLTHSVYESRALAEAARVAGVATQMGNHGQADDSVRDVSEAIWAGAIGDVREVHVWTDRPLKWWPQGIDRPSENHKPHKDLDWDLWLGVAPERPYNRAYHPFRWRGWWDFGTGALGDIGCHSCHPIFRVLKLGHPTSVEANSTKVFDETFPLASIVRYDFPARENMPEVKLTWYDGGLKPARPDEIDHPLGAGGTLYIGDKGKILNNRLIPKARMEEYVPPPKMLPRSPGHYEEWVQACKGGPAAGANFDEAGLVTEVVLLGNIALRTGRRLEWDGPNLRITNVAEANDLLRREYRKGWSL